MIPTSASIDWTTCPARMKAGSLLTIIVNSGDSRPELGKQRLRLLRVSRHDRVALERRTARSVRPAGYRRRSCRHDDLVDDVAVDRGVDRLAELLVRHHLVLAFDVELDVDVAEAGDVDDLDLRRLSFIPSRSLVATPSMMSSSPDSRLLSRTVEPGHRPVDDLVEVDVVLVPVVGKLLHGDMVLNHPLLELEGSGADRGIGEGIGVDGLDRGWRQHHAGAVGELGEERRERLAEDPAWRSRHRPPRRSRWPGCRPCARTPRASANARC